jgi:hypothetical protein
VIASYPDDQVVSLKTGQAGVDTFEVGLLAERVTIV